MRNPILLFYGLFLLAIITFYLLLYDFKDRKRRKEVRKNEI